MDLVLNVCINVLDLLGKLCLVSVLQIYNIGYKPILIYLRYHRFRCLLKKSRLLEYNVYIKCVLYTWTTGFIWAPELFSIIIPVSTSTLKLY